MVEKSYGLGVWAISFIASVMVVFGLKRFVKNLAPRFGAKRPDPIDVVGVSLLTCVPS
jgi:hypothetical protein